MQNTNNYKIPLSILKGIFIFAIIIILIVIPLVISEGLWFLPPGLLMFLFLFIFLLINSKEINEKNPIVENKAHILYIFCWIVVIITFIAGFFMHKLKDPILLFGWITVYFFMIISSILKIREKKKKNQK